MAVERFYRYGVAAEKKVFETNAEYFDGLVIPAHLVCDQPSLTAFIRSVRKQYFVDPMTFAFAVQEAELVNDDRTGLKRSYDKLARSIQWPSNIDFAAGGRVSPAHFGPVGRPNAALVRAFVDSVLKVQDRLSVDAEERDELAKLAELAEAAGAPLSSADFAAEFPPHFLVAPYFFFDGAADPWYSLSVEFLRAAKELAEGRQVYGVVAVSEQFLHDSAAHERLAADYAPTDGMLVWIDDFRDYTRGADQLRRLRGLYRTLSGRERKPIVAMYGSAFQALLEPDGLRGFSSGLVYSDSKPRSSATGGIAPPRFFINHVLQSWSRDDVALFMSQFGAISCRCAICSSIPGQPTDAPDWIDRFLSPRYFPPVGPGGRTPPADGNQLTALKTHFIQSVAAETRTLAALPRAEAAAALLGRYDEMRERNEVLGGYFGRHLATWAQALSAE